MKSLNEALRNAINEDEIRELLLRMVISGDLTVAQALVYSDQEGIAAYELYGVLWFE